MNAKPATSIEEAVWSGMRFATLDRRTGGKVRILNAEVKRKLRALKLAKIANR